MRFKSYLTISLKTLNDKNDNLLTIVIVLHTSSWKIFKKISMQNLIQIYHKVQDV